MSNGNNISNSFIHYTIYTLRNYEHKKHSAVPFYALAGRAADIIEELLRVTREYDAYKEAMEEALKKEINDAPLA